MHWKPFARQIPWASTVLLLWLKGWGSCQCAYKPSDKSRWHGKFKPAKQKYWQSHRLLFCLGELKNKWPWPRVGGQWKLLLFKKKKKEQISASCHHSYGQKVTVHQAEQKAFWTCFTSSPTTNLLWKPPEQSGLFHSAQTKTTLPAWGWSIWICESTA